MAGPFTRPLRRPLTQPLRRSLTQPLRRSVTRPLRRLVQAAVAAAIVLVASGAAVFAGPTGPAVAAPTVGYVRLAHLSPDTPEVDVYLAKYQDSSFTPQRFEGVGYGKMSQYLALPVGTYTVAMRKAGDPESTPPVLTTTVTVEAGGAYTVAGVGEFAKLGLTVLDDDLSRPADGKAKVRVIQASVAFKVIDVALANGTPIAAAVPFATTTPYQVVSPGTWTLKVNKTGSAASTTLSARLGVGNVYSLLVLDGTNGLTTELRADARGGEAPYGGVETGVGGTASAETAPKPGNTVLLVGAGVATLLVMLAVTLRLRRTAIRKTSR